MAAVAEQSRTVTSKQALRHWKEVTDQALREPVVITAHGRPRHVLLAYEDYQRLRDQERQAHLTAELPADLASAILEDLDRLRAPGLAEDDNAFSHLSAQERLDLIGVLWEGLDPEAVPVTGAQRAEIERRLATLDKDIEKGRDAADVLADLRRRHG